ncbi:serine protease [Phaeobacter sp. S60]|uniref:trypsin-like serine peptidase n=1 Tax=Phaeobacter sp. S60 TaxID=1569353 RepID=UPI0009E1FF1F|nr:serine protease [Phaeobacter sp. S60]
MTLDEVQISMMAAAEERLGSHLSRIQSTERRITERSERILGRSATRNAERGSWQSETITHRADPAGLLERLVGNSNDIVSIEFLEAGLLARRAVGRIWDGDQSYSTGFHVGLGLVMTTAHSLPSIAAASDHVLQMDYEEQSLGPPRRISEFSLDPETFFMRNEEYDVAICAATDFAGIAPPLDTFGWHVFSGEDEDTSSGTPVSLIQHPNGEMKSLVVHNSHFVDTGRGSDDDRYCWYTADTKPGSSGSPVFDPSWRLLALHHSAVPARNPQGTILDRDGSPLQKDGVPVTDVSQLNDLANVLFRANEGIRASRLVGWLKSEQNPDPTQEALREKLLDLWRRPGARRIAQQAAVLGSASV